MTSKPPQKSNTLPLTAQLVGQGVIRIESETLFAAAHEVEILHKGQSYRLRQTSLGKLILTK